MNIQTDRLRLRPWTESDRDVFAALHADPVATQDYGITLSREISDKKFDRYKNEFERHGYTRWAMEDGTGKFLGYTGIMTMNNDHALGAHVDIGWRLCQTAWGKGYVTEAAPVVLQDAFNRVGLQEVLAYTSSDNVKSQAVMTRIGMTRDESRDFSDVYDLIGRWHGLVWSAKPGQLCRANRLTSHLYNQII